MNNSDYKISVIMPALNEENNIEDAVNNVVGAFKKKGVNGEIVVINDGSSDNTENIVRALMQQHRFIKMIKHENPIGVGTSFWEGVQNASGEIVVFIPGDGENNAYETLQYIDILEHTDLVIPYVYNTNVRPLSRRILSKLYKNILNMTFGTEIKYLNGTVMYRKLILKNVKLKSTGFFFQAELVVKCIKNGYLYAEVPYFIKKRVYGDSKAVTFKSLLKICIDYLKIIIELYMKKKNDIEEGSVTASKRYINN
ncbi:MAG: glycosyltransferase family 2 protein [Nitrospinae bacterium]|nr:glycosyltransferase family 2 protein [Nitrospinota bacterium]